MKIQLIYIFALLIIGKMKHIFKFIALAVLLTVSATSCNRKNDRETFSENIYARLFSIHGDTIEIGKEKYILYPKDSTEALKRSPYHLPYPVESVVCMSTNYISYFKLLEAADYIDGVASADLIYDSSIREKVKAGKIYDVGFENALDYEKIMKARPDLVITYTIDGYDSSYITRLRELGIKVIAITEYLENHPLGKLEYLKLFGKLIGKEGLADGIFTAKENAYLSLADSIRQQTGDFKKVMMNIPVQGNWYIPGGASYMSLLMKDAGGEIAGAIPGKAASSTMNLEEAIILAAGCDLWMNPHTFTSLEELGKSNPLFKGLPMFEKGQVFNNTARMNEFGGNDFWENGSVYPELVLRDLNDIINGRYDRLVFHMKLK